MTSEELNAAISDLEATDGDMEGYKGDDKKIPYIGWFWRAVDFDKETYSFGHIQSRGVSLGGLQIEGAADWFGFMENNKWDYGYSRDTTPKEWSDIKSLLETYVGSPCVNTANAAWDAIQAVGKPSS